MISELGIRDETPDELASMSEVALDEYCRATASYVTRAIRELAGSARERLPVKEKPTVRSHWFCAVEVDIPEGELPGGSDAIPRRAVESAIMRVHPEAQIGVFCSGWGLNADGFRWVCDVSAHELACVDEEHALRRDQKPACKGCGGLHD